MRHDTLLPKILALLLLACIALFFRPAQAAKPITPSAQGQALDQAYALYIYGDLAASSEAYLRIVQVWPQHAHSLNALGMIALRQHKLAQARHYFDRALQADPENSIAAAQSALLLNSDKAIDALLARHDDAATHFAVGYKHAQRGNWQQAQTHFFNAYALDTDNPDVLNNLAVSLDQLGREDIAQGFYRQALDAAKRRPASFDTASVQARLVHAFTQEPQP